MQPKRIEHVAIQGFSQGMCMDVVQEKLLCQQS
jgi:hypothetical protein